MCSDLRSHGSAQGNVEPIKPRGIVRLFELTWDSVQNALKLKCTNGLRCMNGGAVRVGIGTQWASVEMCMLLLVVGNHIDGICLYTHQ